MTHGERENIERIAGRARYLRGRLADHPAPRSSAARHMRREATALEWAARELRDLCRNRAGAGEGRPGLGGPDRPSAAPGPEPVPTLLDLDTTPSGGGTT